MQQQRPKTHFQNNQGVHQWKVLDGPSQSPDINPIELEFYLLSWANAVRFQAVFDQILKGATPKQTKSVCSNRFAHVKSKCSMTNETIF